MALNGPVLTSAAEVLKAAGTKWNFLKFKPGLVGGHCIGVDPYYLTHKAEMLGYHPQVILAGRRINDGMASYVAKQTVKHMIHGGGCTKGATVIVLGLTFKEDCADLRNSKVADLVTNLQGFGLNVVVHEPVADVAEAEHKYGVHLETWDDLSRRADAIELAVSHRQYRQTPLADILARLNRVVSSLISSRFLMRKQFVRQVSFPGVFNQNGYQPPCTQ